MIEHPASQHGFGRLFEPLIDQSSDFTFQIRSVVQASEFKALKGRTRSGMQVVNGGHNARYRHGRRSSWEWPEYNRPVHYSRWTLLRWHESCLVLSAMLWITSDCEDRASSAV